MDAKIATIFNWLHLIWMTYREQLTTMVVFEGKQKMRLSPNTRNALQGLGRIAEPYHFKTDKDVEPVVNPPRKIPETLLSKLKDELEKMEQSGVISKLNEPTPRVNFNRRQ